MLITKLIRSDSSLSPIKHIRNSWFTLKGVKRQKDITPTFAITEQKWTNSKLKTFSSKLSEINSQSSQSQGEQNEKHKHCLTWGQGSQEEEFSESGKLVIRGQVCED
jgi:hypothetical protein